MVIKYDHNDEDRCNDSYDSYDSYDSNDYYDSNMQSLLPHKKH